MSKVVYECMFLLDPNAYARDAAGVSQKLHDIIENAGGKLLAGRLWNEQRLAYPVDGHRKGVYWLTYFELESTDMPKFKRAVSLYETVLRHLSLKIDPRLVDLMVSAARGERVIPSRAAEAAPAPAAKQEENVEQAETVET